MNIVHIIPNVKAINYGVWKVVLDSCLTLNSFQNKCYIIVLSQEEVLMDELLKFQERISFFSVKEANTFISANFLNSESIIVSHGCWTTVSYLGYLLSKKRYQWVVYPHGMLEPWSLLNKRLKKWIYYNLFEKRFLRNANRLIAVGKPELINLRNTFKLNKVEHIPNGIQSAVVKEKEFDKVVFTYIARLHHKKGVFELVSAWINSKILKNEAAFQLNIAGPDEGELRKLVNECKGVSNIRILGPLYQNDKFELLNRSHFFILPSYSEGFPTSIIEAMTFGCIPIITKGCNFPEIEDAEFAFLTRTDVNEIREVLEEVSTFNESMFAELSKKAKSYIDENYSMEMVASKQLNIFKKVLSEWF